MLSPDSSEFIPRGMRPLVTSGDGGHNHYAKHTVPSMEQRHQSNEDSGQKFKLDKREGSRRNATQTRESFGEKRMGSFNRGRNTSYNAQAWEKNSVRNYDNWRQRADGQPPDVDSLSARNSNTFGKSRPERDGKRETFRHNNKGLWKPKDESSKLREKDDGREKKGTYKGKNHNAGIGTATVLKPQSSSFCKPGVSYGKILSGDYARPGKSDDVANTANSGVKTSNDDQWPSLGGFGPKTLPNDTSTMQVLKSDGEKPRDIETGIQKGKESTKGHHSEGMRSSLENETHNTSHNHVKETKPNSKKKEKHVTETVETAFQWQVKRDRKKQIKPREEGATANQPVEFKGEKVNKTDVKSTATPNYIKENLSRKEKKVGSTSGFQELSEVDKSRIQSQIKKEETITEEPSKLTAKKLKKKEEKMRKRELKIKQAQDMMKKDSKISMISEAFLESAHSSGSVPSWSLTSMSGQDNLQNFPSLADQSRENRRKKIASKGSQPIDKKKKAFTKDSGKQVTTQSSNDERVSNPKSAVGSYSGILLTSPKKVAAIQPESVETSPGIETKAPKTKDRINLDILSAALQTKKMKKTRKDRTLMSELHPTLDNSRKNVVDVVVKGSKNAFAGGTKGRGISGTTTLYRGFQREAKKHHLSPLKKRMQKARLKEAETLLAIVREAKKAQEKLIQEAMLEEQRHSSVSPVAKEENDVRPEAEEPQMSTSQESTEVKELLKVEESHSSEVVDDKKDELNQETVAIAESNSAEIENSNSNSVEVNESESAPEVKLQDTCSVANTENAIVCKEIKEIVKEIKSYDVSPMQVGNYLANLNDPELSERCSDLAKEIRLMTDPVHMHSSFREYCDHVITPEINAAVKQLIIMLVRFQQRQYQRDPLKAKIRRRYVCGLREATKLMNKMTCIVVAPDIKRSRGPGLLDEVVMKLLNKARENGVPIIFSLSAKRIGRLCLKIVPVSCLGIINYQGAQDVFNQVMELIPSARTKYQELIKRGVRSVPVGDGLSDDESEVKS